MKTSSSKIALSGASGMLGTAMRHSLAARNVLVIQLVRRPASAPGEIGWNQAKLPPIADPNSLEGISAAIHLSGANVAGHRWTEAYKREMTASRVDSTRALAALLASLRRPPQVLLVASAVGIYGDRGDEVLDENSAPGSGFLANLCEQWEAAAQPARDAGIRVVHIRSGVVLALRRGSARNRQSSS